MRLCALLDVRLEPGGAPDAVRGGGRVRCGVCGRARRGGAGADRGGLSGVELAGEVDAAEGEEGVEFGDFAELGGEEGGVTAGGDDVGGAGEF